MTTVSPRQETKWGTMSLGCRRMITRSTSAGLFSRLSTTGDGGGQGIMCPVGSEVRSRATANVDPSTKTSRHCFFLASLRHSTPISDMRDLPHTRSCFVCGESNPIGMKLRFVTDGRFVETRFVPSPEHIGLKQ